MKKIPGIGKIAAVLVAAKIASGPDAEAQTRVHANAYFASPRAHYGGNYGNLCGPPFYGYYYHIYSMHAAAPRIPFHRGGAYGILHYRNFPMPRYYVNDGRLQADEDVFRDDEDGFRDDEIEKLKDDIRRLEAGRDGSETEINGYDEDGRDGAGKRPAMPEKDFSYTMRYSGSVCDEQLDDVAIGYMQAVFDCEREMTDWKNDYAAYDMGGYRLSVRDGDSKKVGEIDLRKYSGKSGREIISEIREDIRNMGIVDPESIGSVRVDYRNYSCGD